MSVNRAIKVAFVGAGYMTSEHLKAFKDIEGVECSGITSRTKSRAEKLAKELGVSNVYNSITEMYEKTEADAVVISVPELSTRDVSFEAFKFPWKILIEKPVGYNLEDARIILDEAKSKNREVFVALNRRHYSSTNSVLNELNEIDGRRLITIYDQEDPKAALAAGQPKKVVDNWMYANSIHVIDLFHLFARGSVKRIEPLVHWDPKNPFIVMAKLEFESGDLGIYQAIWNAPGPWAVTVSTPMKRFELRPLESAQFQNRGERKMTDYAIDEWDQKFKPGLRKQADLLVESIKNDSNTTLPTLDEANQSMEMIHKIYSNG